MASFNENYRQNFKDDINDSPVIIHMDVDAFECQVYQRNRPDLEGLPVIVANNSSGRGRITSVNYEAKSYDVSRKDSYVDNAFIKCPDLTVLYIPQHPRWGKPDTSIARHASWEILDSILRFRNLNHHPMIINSSSCDDYYFNVGGMVSARMNNIPLPESQMSENITLEGPSVSYGPKLESRVRNLYWDDYTRNGFQRYKDEARLMHGAVIADEISEAVRQDTGFGVSCGIGNNKIIAKLATGLHKPQGITVLTQAGFDRLSKQISVEEISGLGGETGQELKYELDLNTISDLQQVPLEDLQYCLRFKPEGLAEKMANRSFGIDYENVEEKTLNESIGCSKTFNEIQFGCYHEFVEQIEYLVEEIMKRIDEEKKRSKRVPGSLKMEVTMWNRENSKICSSFDYWPNVEKNKLFQLVLGSLYTKGFKPDSFKYQGVKSVRIMATKFEMRY